MGGSAFSPEFYTPRMPPEVYDHVRHQILDILRSNFYLHAESPIEAPEKVDYGDIDIIVSDLIAPVFCEDGLEQGLGSAAMKKIPGSCTIHFALPWPEEFKDTVSESETPETLVNRLKTIIFSPFLPAPSTPPVRYIQLDLHTCPNVDLWRWELFQNAHGDFWNIVGGTIRRYGLTISNSGFYVRIAEIEAHNKKLARIKLTETPNEVLGFLGLDDERFWRPFKTLDEMMDYASACNFHDPSRFKDPNTAKAEMKASDRQRVKKRDIFAFWIEDYLPRHRQTGTKGKMADFSREQVVQVVKNYFPHIAENFEQRRTTEMRRIGIEQLWVEVKKNLPKATDASLQLIDGLQIGYITKGLKREVADPELEKKRDDELNEIQLAFREMRFDDVLAWAGENWKEVGERQRALDYEKSSQNLRDKIERERVKAVHRQELEAQAERIKAAELQDPDLKKASTPESDPQPGEGQETSFYDSAASREADATLESLRPERDRSLEKERQPEETSDAMMSHRGVGIRDARARSIFHTIQ